MFTLTSEVQTLLLFLTGIAGALISAGWVSQGWLSKKFAETNTMIDYKIEKLEKAIVEKMEYHERHDDQRFSEVRTISESRFNEVKNDIWDIRVRNAAKDGHIPLRSKDKDKQ